MYGVIPRTILFREEHSRRTLVPKVEFASARGTPAALLTGKALFSWQKDKRRFRLESVHPGNTPAGIREHTGFDYDVAPACGQTVAPSTQELEILRTQVRVAISENYPEFAARIWGAQ